MFSKNKKVLAIVLSAIVLVAALCAVYFFTRTQPDAQAKTITVEVVFSETDQKEYNITTSEEYLRGALDQEKLIDGSDSQYGFFVTVVAGVTADDNQQQWWCFTKNGEELMEGVDTIPIFDQDHFEIMLKTGY